MSEFDFLLAGISHYFEVRFEPAEGHTQLHYTGNIFLYFSQKLTWRRIYLST